MFYKHLLFDFASCWSDAFLAFKFCIQGINSQEKFMLLIVSGELSDAFSLKDALSACLHRQ